MSGDPASAADVVPAPIRGLLPARDGTEPARTVRDFLPAALQVQQQPPSPTGRLILWLILALFSVALLWSALGEVDIVVSAPGKLIPSGRVKLIQAPASAIVLSVEVREGSRVDKGQRLVQLDTTSAEADGAIIAVRLAQIETERHWRTAFGAWLASGPGSLEQTRPAAQPAAGDLTGTSALFERHRDELSARLSALHSELEASEQEGLSLLAERDRVLAALDIHSERVAAYKALVDQQYGARLQYLEILQQQTDLKQSLPVIEHRRNQALLAAAALEAQIAATVKEAQRQNLVQLARLQAEYADLRQQARKAGRKSRQLLITAPVAGTVQELTVHTQGAVVTPAQVLMKIVPTNTRVEVEALLMNRDIGFVEEGQRAEVKLDAFNFTKYGLLTAKIANISDDAVQDPQHGWVFKMRLTLDQDTINIDGREVRPGPGMATLAEIHTGKRRLIEFFLSPLLRYRQESLRER